MKSFYVTYDVVVAFDEFEDWIRKHHNYLVRWVMQSTGHNLIFLGEAVGYPYALPYYQKAANINCLFGSPEEKIRTMRLMKAWIFVNKERLDREHLFFDEL
jgi:hypothetical protein